MAGRNGDPTTFYCEVCEEEIGASRQIHEQDPVHLARVNYKERLARRDTWMKTKSTMGLHAFTGVKTDMPRIPMDLQVKDWIPVAKQPLLGMEHVVEVMQYQNSGPRYYVCKMCGVSNIQVFEHMTSVGHRLQYLVNHHNEVSEYLQNASLSSEDRQVLANIIESKAWPTEEMLKKGNDLRSTLLDLAVKITSGMKRKRFQMAIETQPSGIRRARQKCLSSQIQGHTEDHYPPYLVERLYFYGANFAFPSEDEFQPEMPMEQGHSGGYGEPQPAPLFPGAQRRPLTMGEAKRQSMADEKLTFLNWLQITQQKLAAEPVSGQDVSSVENIISLLDCGIKIYKSDPRPSEICYYTQGQVTFFLDKGTG